MRVKKRSGYSIEEIDERTRRLILRIRRAAIELEELDSKRRRLVTGKLRALPPPGVRRLLSRPDFNDEIGL